MADLAWGSCPTLWHIHQGGDEARTPIAWILEAARDSPGITLHIYSRAILPNLWGLANKTLSMDKWLDGIEVPAPPISHLLSAH